MTLSLKILSITSLFTLLAIQTTGRAAEPLPPPNFSTPEQNDNDEDIPSSVPSPGDNTDVTIIRRKDAVIEEVRVKGKLRYAKITPTKGKPYYLYDSDGDGVLDATETDLKKANVNQWILMQW